MRAVGDGYEGGRSREEDMDLDLFLQVMDSELGKAEGALTQYNTWSTDPAAVALRTRIDTHRQMRVTLVAVKRGSF